MKVVLLEHPRRISAMRINDVANAPLCSSLFSGYVAAMLKARGHELEIIEGYLEGLTYPEIENRIRALKPYVLGVHMVYLWRKDSELFQFLERIKKEGFARYIVAYGFYPTFAPEEVLKGCAAVDGVVMGEPEVTFTELVDLLAAGTFPRSLPGLAVRHGENISYIWREPLENLDALPFPWRTEAMYRLPQVNIQGSRGCYGRCTFCYINPFYGPTSRWRGRSPENIAAEMETILTDRGLRSFYFVDPNFFGPGARGQDRARRLARILKGWGIRLGLEARANDIQEEVIAELVEAGLCQVFLGLESGSNRVLKRMNKMTTVEQNERAIRILRKCGVQINVGFIMFEPDASLEDIRDNFEFLQRNGLLEDLEITANVLYHYQIILKGTPAYRKLEQEGRLKLLPDTSYEGKPSFADARVAALAEVMHSLTNFVFVSLEDIWSGKLGQCGDAYPLYAELNRLLVRAFEEALRTLEKGSAAETDLLKGLEEEKKARIAGIIRALGPGSVRSADNLMKKGA